MNLIYIAVIETNTLLLKRFKANDIKGPNTVRVNCHVVKENGKYRLIENPSALKLVKKLALAQELSEKLTLSNKYFSDISEQMASFSFNGILTGWSTGNLNLVVTEAVGNNFEAMNKEI